jgi:hypothetical protein
MNEREISPRVKAFSVMAGAILILILITSFIMHQRHSSPTYTEKLVDKDTGEIAYIQPNKETEKAAGGGDAILFGTSVLFNNGATQDQFQEFKTLINQYYHQTLGAGYQSLTIVPKSVKADTGDIKGKLRLGQGPNLENIEVRLTKLYYVQLIVSDPTGHYKKFDSGIQPENIQG